MKHLLRFYEQTINEAKIAISDTTTSTFTIDTLIQIIDDKDKNIGQAKIKKILKGLYHVQYKSDTYKVNKKDLSLNIHGQIQTEIKNLK